jgi:hypothetical protein
MGNPDEIAYVLIGASSHFPDVPTPERPQLACLSFNVEPTIVWPLDPAVKALMGLSDTVSPSEGASTFWHCINNGQVLFSLHSRSVVRLSEHVVVKIGPHCGTEESAALAELAHSKAFPAPRPFGQVVVGGTSYMFSSFISGDTLANSWPGLTLSQKESVCSQLEVWMSELRCWPRDPFMPLGTISSPHVCKDYQTSVSVSPPDVLSVLHFHDWHVSLASPTISPGYRRWLRGRFKDDYAVVLTHGDFHPRNIMVVKQSDGNIKVSGIIDWEMCGWYPEYYEMYKALNTRSAREESDWWDMLPPCISGYDCEVVTHRLLEQAKPR